VTTRSPTWSPAVISPYYSNLSDFFFQVVFVATAMSIVSGAVAERMKLWSFLAFAVVMTGIIYPCRATGAGAAAS
jgi:ammonia channel protein AmtB